MTCARTDPAARLCSSVKRSYKNKNGPDSSEPLRSLLSNFYFSFPDYRELISGRLSAIDPTGGAPFKLSSICSLRYTSELMS